MHATASSREFGLVVVRRFDLFTFQAYAEDSKNVWITSFNLQKSFTRHPTEHSNNLLRSHRHLKTKLFIVSFDALMPAGFTHEVSVYIIRPELGADVTSTSPWTACDRLQYFQSLLEGESSTISNCT